MGEFGPNRKIDKSNLGYLGAIYQYQLVKCFIEDPGYFQTIYTVIDQNAFTEPLLKRFVGTLKDYYVEHKVVPSYEILTSVLKQRSRMTNEIEEWDALKEKLMGTSSEGSEFIEDNATKFFRQQNMVKVANEILHKAADGNTDSYEYCLRMMEDAVAVGSEEDYGFNPYDIMVEATGPQAKYPIPTGIKNLDDVLNGGLEKKKIGLVIAPSSFGKTTMATAFSSYASTFKCDLNNHEGYKALQITFEDDPVDIARKHFARITGIEAKDLSKNAMQIEETRECLDAYAEKEVFIKNLRIKKYKTRRKTVRQIEDDIKKLIDKGFRPDVVCLDYFECIAFEKSNRNASKWDMQEDTMRDLENMAEELNIALWVFTQGNKDSFVSSVVGMNQGSGSISKAQIGSVVISVARAMQDQLNNLATIAVLKNRQGRSGMVWEGVKFNNGTCEISCDETMTYDDALVYQEKVAETEENTRNMVAEQLKDSLKKKPVAQVIERGIDDPYDFDKQPIDPVMVSSPARRPEPQPMEPVYNPIFSPQQPQNTMEGELLAEGEFPLEDVGIDF